MHRMNSERKEKNPKLNPKTSFCLALFYVNLKSGCLSLQTVFFAFAGITKYMQVYLFHEYYCTASGCSHKSDGCCSTRSSPRAQAAGHSFLPSEGGCPQRAAGFCVDPKCFLSGTSGKESTCQCKRHKGCGFDPWVGKIPWRRAWQPAPVFLPEESHRQRSLEGYSP